MKGDKFEQKLMTGLEKFVEWLEDEPDFIYKDYKDIRTAKMMSFKAVIDKARQLLSEEQAEKPQPTEDEFDIAIETEQNKVINPGMLDMAVSDNDNYKLGFIHGLQKSKYVYRSLATKPTAPASLVERLNKWSEGCYGYTDNPSKCPAMDEFEEIIRSYTPAPGEKPTEGLVEELLKIESELDLCATRPLSDHTLNILCTVMGRLHSLISHHAHDKEAI